MATINDLSVEILRLIIAAHLGNVRSTIPTVIEPGPNLLSIRAAHRAAREDIAEKDVYPTMLVCKLWARILLDLVAKDLKRCLSDDHNLRRSVQEVNWVCVLARLQVFGECIWLSIDKVYRRGFSIEENSQRSLMLGLCKHPSEMPSCDPMGTSNFERGPHPDQVGLYVRLLCWNSRLLLK